MACVDKDKFNLIDHGHDAAVALNQLLRVPAISNGPLGTIIRMIQQEVLPLSEFEWVPQSGMNAGSATGVWKVDNAQTNRIALKGVKVKLMEQKRSQVVHERCMRSTCGTTTSTSIMRRARRRWPSVCRCSICSHSATSSSTT